MIRLSIVIPAYNVERYIEQCIESCENQGLPFNDYEIIIINDGSKDNTLGVAQRLTTKYSNIVVKSQENQGQAVARNLGLDIAKGEYVMFVDSDDYLLDGKIGNLLLKLESLNIDMIEFRFMQENANGDAYPVPDKGLQYQKIYTGEEAALHSFVFASVCGKIYKKSLFDSNNLRFYPGIKHEDSDMCFRLYPFVNTLVCMDEFVYYYRYNELSTDRNKARESVRKSIDSDAVIASRVLALAQKGLLSDKLSDRYKRIANSMIVSFFMNVRIEKLWSDNDFQENLAKLKEMGIYPINGRCSSWKTTLLSRAFNVNCILKLFVTNNTY